MKLLAAALLSLAAVASSAQNESTESIELRMSPAQAKQCEVEGGCGVVTREYVQELRRRAFAAGIEQGKNSCRAGKET